MSPYKRTEGVRAFGGISLQFGSAQTESATFSHPDYTVGSGLLPDRARAKANSRARWFILFHHTAGRELSRVS
jgi:hypothetical protein